MNEWNNEWNEMKWNEMKSSEVKWNDMKCIYTEWNEWNECMDAKCKHAMNE